MKTPAMIPIRPFPKKAVTAPEAFHDLGAVVTPAEQAKAKQADAPPHMIAAAAGQAMDALAGSGPRQTPPHSDTALILEGAMARLRDHALSGDAAAFEWLGYVLHSAVADFHEVARRNPAVAGAWGEKQNTLPILTGRNKGHARDAEAAFAVFRLGEKSTYRVNPGGKAPSADTPVNVLAAGLCQHLAKYRISIELMRPPVPLWARLAAKLPDLKRDTAEQWADAALELLRASFANDAELVDYCGLGDHRADPEAVGVSSQVSEIEGRVRRHILTLATFS